MFAPVRHSTLILGLILLLPYLLGSQSPQKSDYFATDDGAIRGFDPVAYFEVGKAVKGKEAYAVRWQGVWWHFSSQGNLDKFVVSPHAFAPQYGGYCAYAMSKGSHAPSDPQAWTIHDGKLYLNYSKAVRDTWKKDLSGNIQRADKNWASLRAGS